jgi:hypothetical protein
MSDLSPECAQKANVRRLLELMGSRPNSNNAISVYPLKARSLGWTTPPQILYQCRLRRP